MTISKLQLKLLKLERFLVFVVILVLILSIQKLPSFAFWSSNDLKFDINKPKSLKLETGEEYDLKIVNLDPNTYQGYLKIDDPKLLDELVVNGKVDLAHKNELEFEISTSDYIPGAQIRGVILLKTFIHSSTSYLPVQAIEIPVLITQSS